MLALQMERKYSKEEILTMYCNQHYLGHGKYGIEAASQFFFDKSVSELNLEEAALIAGIFRGPSLYSPYNNYELTLQRRNHVINPIICLQIFPDFLREVSGKLENTTILGKNRGKRLERTRELRYSKVGGLTRVRRAADRNWVTSLS